MVIERLMCGLEDAGHDWCADWMDRIEYGYGEIEENVRVGLSVVVDQLIHVL